MTTPLWTDSGQGDLLALVAMGSPTGTADREWEFYERSLRFCATADDGLVMPNTLRALVREHVAPRRIGAFANRAVARGLIEPTGDWQVSDDHQGRNAGRPAKVYRWIGGAQ